MKIQSIVIAGAILAGGVVTPASAQSAVSPYIVGAAGGWRSARSGDRMTTAGSGTLAGAAGGVEWLPFPHLGLAGEAGIFASQSGSVMMTAGGDARVCFAGGRSAGAWSPYVLGGYARLGFFEASDHALQVGAGADYRTSRGALRIELRDLIRRSSSTLTWHYWTMRIGYVF
jgi:hypothetical protein